MCAWFVVELAFFLLSDEPVPLSEEAISIATKGMSGGVMIIENPCRTCALDIVHTCMGPGRPG